MMRKIRTTYEDRAIYGVCGCLARETGIPAILIVTVSPSFTMILLLRLPNCDTLNYILSAVTSISVSSSKLTLPTFHRSI